MKFVLPLVAGSFGLVLLGSCTPEEEPTHGTIRIEVSPLNGNLDILAGTTEVVATVNYRTCLQEFYLMRDPTYQQDGVEGSALFAEFQETMCTFAGTADCEITEIRQSLVEANMVYTLTVTYKINDNDPANLAYREFHVGPLPFDDLAACGGAEGPLVELPQSGLFGRNSNGQQIWRISTIKPPNEAEAGQGAPLRVDVQATNMP